MLMVSGPLLSPTVYCVGVQLIVCLFDHLRVGQQTF